MEETIECPMKECKDRCYGEWECWGECDAVCGTGTRKRNRPCSCDEELCDEAVDEEDCEGDDTLMCTPGILDCDRYFQDTIKYYRRME